MKSPFPYFGGKTMVADIVWTALGDVKHYIEPFCGSCAVLLLRSNHNPSDHVETVNDADGMIANVWRSLQKAPDEVAKYCDWPVNHADLTSRRNVLNLNNESLLENLCKDDDYYDVRMAGYYIWAASCWIGRGLIRPGQRPHLGCAGTGVHAKGPRPHLTDAGTGVHARGQIPHLGPGRGVHAKSLRDNPDNLEGVQEPYNLNIYRWFRELSERLRYVRVVCGDWKRVCGGDWQDKPGSPVGIFFDPPYSDVADRDPDLYSTDSLSVAKDVREWCRTRADRENYRIVLAGYYDEHKELLDEGWTAHRWVAGGGYGNTGNGKSKLNRHKETLFFSPYCNCVKDENQLGLFEP